MPTNDTTTIRARDLRGKEIQLRVGERTGLIAIEGDTGDAIILSPASAIDLVMALLSELGRLVPPAPSGRA